MVCRMASVSALEVVVIYLFDNGVVVGLTHYHCLILVVKSLCSYSLKVNGITNILGLDGLTATVYTAAGASHDLNEGPVCLAACDLVHNLLCVCGAGGNTNLDLKTCNVVGRFLKALGTSYLVELDLFVVLAGKNIVDVDVALTTRELGRMIKRAGIKFTALPDEEFDNPLGLDTGAAVIFGATGGVMEAALRTANDVLTGKDNQEIVFSEVRGTAGLKEATYNIAGTEIKVAVASGAANAKLVMDKIAKGEADWTFVEIMGCPGGCVNGGGQPIQPQYVRDTVDLKAVRAKALYDQDEAMEMRKSHLNPVIKEVYDNYFKGGYGCHAAHHALHTSYVARKKFD